MEGGQPATLRHVMSSVSRDLLFHQSNYSNLCCQNSAHLCERMTWRIIAKCGEIRIENVNVKRKWSKLRLVVFLSIESWNVRICWLKCVSINHFNVFAMCVSINNLNVLAMCVSSLHSNYKQNRLTWNPVRNRWVLFSLSSFDRPSWSRILD